MHLALGLKPREMNPLDVHKIPEPSPAAIGQSLVTQSEDWYKIVSLFLSVSRDFLTQ